MMNQNRNIFLILISVALLVTIILLFLNRKKSTLQDDKAGFAVSDVNRLTKIFLADKSGRSVTLEKDATGFWFVNGKHKARIDLITVLLKTMGSLQIKSPVASAAAANVVKRLAAIAVKVEIYADGDDEPFKTYYVGDATQDGYGTYMMMEGADEPFILHVAGFHGYLTPRYSTVVDDWRDRTLFAIPFKDLQSVKVEYTENPEWSFDIRHEGQWKFSLRKFSGDSLVADYDTMRLNRYLVFYQDIRFENFVRNDSVIRMIRSAPHVHKITAGNVNGESHSIRTCLKPFSADTSSVSGQTIRFDPDRMYAIVDDTLFVTVQYYVIDKLFYHADTFLKEGTGK